MRNGKGSPTVPLGHRRALRTVHGSRLPVPETAPALPLLVIVVGGAAGGARPGADERALLAVDERADPSPRGRADADALGGLGLPRLPVAPSPLSRRRVNHHPQ